MTIHGAGQTAEVYAQHAKLFKDNVLFLNQLLILHPNLRGCEAHVKPGRLEIVTVGGAGIVRDWTRALPPVVSHDSGFYQENGFIGITDVLHTGHVHVSIRRPL